MADPKDRKEDKAQSWEPPKGSPSSSQGQAVSVSGQGISSGQRTDDPNKATIAVTGERLHKDDPNKTDEEKEKDRILARMRTGSPWVVSEEENDKILESVETDEKKNDDGTVTVTKSLSKEEAERASTILASIPHKQNETENLTGVPGEEDLTRGGTLNNDRSRRMKMSLEDLNAEIEKTAGPNPIPNREGNELTKAMLGFRPENSLRVNRLTTVVDELIAGGKLNKEEEKKIKDARAGI